MPNSTPHPEIAEAALALLRRSARARTGEADYDLGRIAGDLVRIGIPVALANDGADLRLGDTVVLPGQRHDARRFVSVIDVGSALYEYCFGERFVFPVGSTGSGYMWQMYLAMERQIEKRQRDDRATSRRATEA